MSYIRELYKLFNLNSISTEDEIEDDKNIKTNKIEKNEQNNYNLLEDIKDDVFNDINEDYINPNNFKTNRYSQVTSINLPKNLEEEKIKIINFLKKYNLKNNKNNI